MRLLRRRRAAESAGGPAPRKKPISGEIAPKETQAMLMTKSPSITRSTLVSSPTDSTIHIWWVRKTVSRSAVSAEAERARGARAVSPRSRRRRARS